MRPRSIGHSGLAVGIVLMLLQYRIVKDGDSTEVGAILEAFAHDRV